MELVLFTLLAFGVSVHGFNTGADSYSCFDMEPWHYPASASQGQAPTRIELDVSEYTPGKPVTVRLIGEFRGVLMQARLVDQLDDNPVGRFSNLPQGILQFLDCTALGDSVTHMDSGLKYNISLFWIPPPRAVGRVHFLATFVRKFDKFWPRQKSSILSPFQARPVPDVHAASINSQDNLLPIIANTDPTLGMAPLPNDFISSPNIVPPPQTGPTMSGNNEQQPPRNIENMVPIEQNPLNVHPSGPVTNDIGFQGPPINNAADNTLSSNMLNTAHSNTAGNNIPPQQVAPIPDMPQLGQTGPKNPVPQQPSPDLNRFEMSNTNQQPPQSLGPINSFPVAPGSNNPVNPAGALPVNNTPQQNAAHSGPAISNNQQSGLPNLHIWKENAADIISTEPPLPAVPGPQQNLGNHAFVNQNTWNQEFGNKNPANQAFGNQNPTPQQNAAQSGPAIPNNQQSGLPNLPLWEGNAADIIPTEPPLPAVPGPQPNLRNQAFGNQNPGNQAFGNQNPGNQAFGNQNPGNQAFGNQNTGNNAFGNQNPGNQTFGNQNPGNQAFGIQNPGNQAFGNQNPGNQEFGNQNSENQAFGSQAPSIIKDPIVNPKGPLVPKPEPPFVSQIQPTFPPVDPQPPFVHFNQPSEPLRHTNNEVFSPIDPQTQLQPLPSFHNQPPEPGPTQTVTRPQFAQPQQQAPSPQLVPKQEPPFVPQMQPDLPPVDPQPPFVPFNQPSEPLRPTNNDVFTPIGPQIQLQPLSSFNNQPPQPGPAQTVPSPQFSQPQQPAPGPQLVPKQEPWFVQQMQPTLPPADPQPPFVPFNQPSEPLRPTNNEVFTPIDPQAQLQPLSSFNNLPPQPGPAQTVPSPQFSQPQQPAPGLLLVPKQEPWFVQQMQPTLPPVDPQPPFVHFNQPSEPLRHTNNEVFSPIDPQTHLRRLPSFNNLPPQPGPAQTVSSPHFSQPQQPAPDQQLWQQFFTTDQQLLQQSRLPPRQEPPPTFHQQPNQFGNEITQNNVAPVPQFQPLPPPSANQWQPPRQQEPAPQPQNEVWPPMNQPSNPWDPLPFDSQPVNIPPPDTGFQDPFADLLNMGSGAVANNQEQPTTITTPWGPIDLWSFWDAWAMTLFN